MHIANCGKFDLHVEWELKSQPTPVTPPAPAGKAAAKPKSASAAKDAAALAAAAPIFLFEPKVRHVRMNLTPNMVSYSLFLLQECVSHQHRVTSTLLAHLLFSCC